MTEGFLGRWSRLKRTAPEQPEPQNESTKKPLTSELDEVQHYQDAALDEFDQASIDEQAAVLETPSDREQESVNETVVLTDADMPDLTTINAKSDMSMFWSSGVSAELRRQALRKFFHQPEFNFRDPLDDYALDYSQPKKLVQEVGDKVRGWAQQQMDEAMQKARDALLQADAPVDSSSAIAASDSSESLKSNENLDCSTKVDEADQDGKNGQV